MTTPEINAAKAFFQAVSSGSVPYLQEVLISIEPEEKGKIVNSFNSEGETPLLVAVIRNHHEMVKFLVDNLKADIFKMGRFKWKGIEYEEALPLFVAILLDCTCDQSIINFLVAKDTTYTSTPSGLKPIFLSDTIPCSQKFDMLDLIGCAYMLHPDSETGRVLFATRCWCIALHLRTMHFEALSDSSFLKPPTSLSASTQQVFGRTTEFRTLDELDHIVSQIDLFLLETQALLVIERIMSRLDPDPHPFFLRRLLNFSRDWFGNANQYRSSMDVVKLILELFHSRQWIDVIEYHWCHCLVVDAVSNIMYSRWKKKESPPDRSQLPFDSIMDAINYATDLVFKLQKHPDPLQKKKAMKIIVFMEDSVVMFTEHDKQTSEEFRKWLAIYIKFTNSHPGVFTVLHANCQTVDLSTKIVQMFLDGGADPTAKDETGNTPLHCLAMSKNFSNVVVAATKLLLSVGAHLDQVNDYELTPLDLFKSRKTYLDQKGLPDPYIDALTRTVLPLSCLSAQVIRRNSIPFEDREQLPSHLIPFIQSHSAKYVIKVDLSKWFTD